LIAKTKIGKFKPGKGPNEVPTLEEMISFDYPCLTEEMLHRDARYAPGGATQDCVYLYHACDGDNVGPFPSSEHARRVDYSKRPYLTLKKNTMTVLVQDERVAANLVYSYFDDDYYEMIPWMKLATPSGWKYANLVSEPSDERLAELGFERKTIPFPRFESWALERYLVERFGTRKGRLYFYEMRLMESLRELAQKKSATETKGGAK